MAMGKWCVLMNNAQLINQDSGDVEYYTPAAIVNPLRAIALARIAMEDERL